MLQISRKKFLRSTILSSSGLLFLSNSLFGQDPKVQIEKGPPIDTRLVKEFVGAAHKDLGKVQEMYAANPDLLNSVNNLGGWDWEDAVGAAGHVGHRELATFLLQKGARPTICVCAMLGKLDVVKAFINSWPEMREAVGPHKISLLKHAKSGGTESQHVVEFLTSIGAKS